MKILCKRSYLIDREVLFTNKKYYITSKPHITETSSIYIWVLDNNNEWVFLTKRNFEKYFEEIEIKRERIINDLLDRQ